MCVTVSDWWKFNRAKRRFGEEIQTKNYDIYNINEVMIETRMYWFFSIAN